MNNSEFRSGFVSIIGRPNVGKSTLLNSLLGEKAAIVSNKPQTTRNIIRGVMTTDSSQLVFLDTPGIHKGKHKLSENMLKMAQSSAASADIVLLLISAYSGRANLESLEIARGLADMKVPVFLLINKIDTIEKGDILPIIEEFSALANFAEIIPISAIKGENLGLLKEKLPQYLPIGPKYFPDDTVVDAADEFIISEMIREKALHLLSEEIPHGVAVAIERLAQREDKDIIDIEATIYCEKSSHKGIIIGKGGAMLKEIGMRSRADISRIYDAKINLQLWVKVKENWRNQDFYLRNFGLKAEK